MKTKQLNGDNMQSSKNFQNLIRPLIDLIAEESIWVNPAKMPKTAVYPDKRRGKPADKGKVIDGIKIDDNTYANKAIKNTISKDIDFLNYQVCHIWPGTTYDERYHTHLANLVLIPRVIAGLSDFCPAIIDVLKYRAWELYGWYPEEESKPVRPEYYPEHWNDFIKDIEYNSSEKPMDLDDYLAQLEEQDASMRDELEYYNDNREEIEIEKVRRRIPKWHNNPKQICSIILNCFMQLSNNGSLPVKKDELKALSEQAGVDTFETNYNQMKNISIKNHAKVFQEDNGQIYLWAPVSTFIKGLYK